MYQQSASLRTTEPQSAWRLIIRATATKNDNGDWLTAMHNVAMSHACELVRWDLALRCLLCPAPLSLQSVRLSGDAQQLTEKEQRVASGKAMSLCLTSSYQGQAVPG